MPLRRPIPAPTTGRSPRPGTAAPSRSSEDESAHRPPIWIEGRQAPPFDPMTFAQAGMLLAREASAAALLGLSRRSAALSGHLAERDWSRFTRHLGRPGRWLPTAAGSARTLCALSHCAEAAQRLLFALPDPTGPGAAPPSPRPAPQDPLILTRRIPAHPPAKPADPELAAIRALIAAERPTSPKHRAQSSRDRQAPRSRPNRPSATGRLSSRIGRWSAVRLLAGGALAIAAPLGYTRALWRHLEGTDLREIVAECQRTPTD